MKSQEPEAFPRAFQGIDKTIHEPARLMLMTLLSVVKSGDVTYLMAHSGLTWGNISSHLKKLKEAGHIDIEKSFVDNKPNTKVLLTADGRKAFDKYRRTMSEILDLD